MGSDSAPAATRLQNQHQQTQHEQQHQQQPAAPGQSEPPRDQPLPHAPSSSSQTKAEAFASNSTFPDPFQASAGASPIFHIRQPSTAGLSLRTGDLDGDGCGSRLVPDDADQVEARPRNSSSLSRVPLNGKWSFDNANGLRSPPSSVSSPMLGSLADVTPLPSPIFPPNSPDLWKRVAERASRSRGNSAASIARDEALLGPSALAPSPSRSNKKKTYHGLRQATGSAGSAAEMLEAGHAGLRSTSEYTPETLSNVRPRNVTLPATDVLSAANSLSASNSTESQTLTRERDFAARQKSTASTPATATIPAASETLPTPPASDKSTADSEESKELGDQVGPLRVFVTKEKEQRDFKPIRRLGTGSFSQVVLATDKSATATTNSSLVAIKVVSHDPSAKDDERMEASIQREIEMLNRVSHPSLPRLLGSEDTPTRALLVLEYCAGGDLFDVATQRRDLLSHAMIQRIFAELVEAVFYLHELNIVHRDVKLENILCNIPIAELEKISDVRTHPSAVITLTDLGLSKHIDPASPLLTHACGSTDYAAPELLLGQSYDGRSTDAWALGVLLYALLEGRLPFDPLPGKRNTGNVKHRIARCDWLWCTYGDRYGDWIEEKGKGLEGAREVVEGLLKKAGRGRWSLEKVREHSWVQQGIQVSGGLRLA